MDVPKSSLVDTPSLLHKSSFIRKDEVDIVIGVMGAANAMKSIEDSHTDTEGNNREKLIDEEPATKDNKHLAHND